MTHEAQEVTKLLAAWSQGDRQALEELAPLVIDELRTIAGELFRREGGGHTLQPTAVVNELFLRLLESRSVDWQNRRHFFRTAARIMRRLLVDHARCRQAGKRGGEILKVPLIEEMHLPYQRQPADLLALDEALERLKEMAPRQSQVVELKCFIGLKIEEIAENLGVGLTTVKKDWRVARAWLIGELDRGDGFYG